MKIYHLHYSENLQSKVIKVWYEVINASEVKTILGCSSMPKIKNSGPGFFKL